MIGKLSAEGLEVLRMALDRIVVKMQEAQSMGTEPAWLGEVAAFEAKQQEQTWATEGAASGERWPDLAQGDYNSAGYIKWRRRRWGDKKLLVWSGETRDSFRFVKHRDHIARTSGRFMEFGSRAKLAKSMHEGQSYSTPKIVYLREPSPRKKRDKRTGKMTKGSNWFRLRMTSIPPRPLARKSQTQVLHLSLKAGRELLLEASRISGGKGNAFSRGLAQYAESLRPDPRA